MPERVRHDGGILTKRIESQADRQIVPSRIVALDQILLPVTAPFLDALLTGDGILHRICHIVPDETDDAVAFGETLKRAVAVLEDSTDQVRGHAYVKGAIEAIGQDVDAGLPVPHAFEIAAWWTPEQVRGDGTFRHAGLVPASTVPHNQGVAA